MENKNRSVNHVRLVLTYFSFTLALLCGNKAKVFSQSATTSPFSRYGIGLINENGFLQNIAMGGLSAPIQTDTITPYNINPNNPASLPYIRLTTFEAALNSNATQLSAGGQTQISTATTLNHLAFAFPLYKWWATGLSLQPLSSVGYKISNTGNQDTIGAINNTYNGNGGLHKVTFSNGFKYKQLSFGVNASYVFGGIVNEREVILPANGLGYYNAEAVSRVNANDVYLDYGLQYGMTIKRLHHRELRDYIRVVIGASFGFTSNINVNSTILTRNFIYNAASIKTYRDTVENITAKSTITLPGKYAIGLSLRKGDKYLIGMEYARENWSSFQYLGDPGGLANTSRFIIGGEIVPSHKTENNAPYFNKVSYRFGFREATLPIRVNGGQLPETAFSFGLGFPIGFSRHMYNYNMLNVSLEAGQRGTAATMKENFFNFVIGISINDKWFVRSKFD